MSIFSRITAAFGSPKNGRLRLDDDFVDIDLPIVQSEYSDQTGQSVIARGKVNGEIVGFAFDFGAHWDEKPLEDDPNVIFYWGNARIRSTGQDSDSFTKLLATLYGSRPLPGKMPERIDVLAVGLANDPRLAPQQPTKMKLFFAPDSESDYAEVFLNLDLSAKWLEFHEKDSEYREPLLRALGGGG